MNGTPARLAALAATGVLACLLLAGCGGGSSDGDATPAPSFSLSTSSPVPPTSSAPVTPSSSAAAETPEAFVRRWNDLSTEMQNTGATANYRSISTDCSACLGTADLVDQYYRSGGYVRTKGWAIKSVHCTSTSSTEFECTANVSNPITSYKTSSSSAQMTFPAGPFTEFFRVDGTSNRWNMSFIAEQAT